MTDRDFSEQLANWRAAIEHALDRHTPAADTRPERLHAAMRHSLSAGGKRLRPVLVLASHALFESEIDPLPAGVAVECLHTYSLIHDDLPCMDDADTRRGQPSCHAAFDEATAVLAGDALLTHALYLLAEAYADHPAVAVALVRDLGDAAGSQKLIGGQMADILSETRPGTADELGYIHRNKTAALISACFTMGARLTSASAGEVETMGRIGTATGLAFQIVDDLLDATSDDETLGKAAGSDAIAEKLTYVRLHGLEASRKRAAELTEEAIGLCRSLDADTVFLEELVNRMGRRVR